MSTVSTSLNSSATLLMRDYYQRYINRSASERQSMTVLYGATVVWGLLGTGIAIVMIHIKSVLDAWWTLSGIFSGGMLGLFLLGIISRRAKNPAAITAVLGGVVLILWFTFSLTGTERVFGWRLPQGLRVPLHEYFIPVLGTLAILLIGLLVSRFAGPRGGIVPESSTDKDWSVERAS
jgi:solute:Na+ symporter, SSS family